MRKISLADADDGEQEADQGEVFTITSPVLHDVSPAFDPQGKYLYFLSHREFNPVYDGLHFRSRLSLGHPSLPRHTARRSRQSIPPSAGTGTAER